MKRTQKTTKYRTQIPSYGTEFTALENTKLIIKRSK